MAGCGKKETCGGYFSSGPGDSDWQTCEEHAADSKYWGTIYVAQLAAAVNRDPIPSTAQECLEYITDPKT